MKLAERVIEYSQNELQQVFADLAGSLSRLRTELATARGVCRSAWPDRAATLRKDEPLSSLIQQLIAERDQLRLALERARAPYAEALGFPFEDGFENLDGPPPREVNA